MSQRGSRSVRLLAAGAAALALSGCVSLLPKQKPALLYRFDGDAPAAAPAARGGPRVGVLRAGGTFQRESAGDRFLTITGDRAAYVARARWVAPAEVLFDEAVTRAFDAASGPVRLVVRGEPTKADRALRIDVRNFETHYVGESPTVVVRVRATLLGGRPAGSVEEKMFEASVPASDNRIAAIATAYDQAVGRVIKGLVAWTEATAGG